ncbi:ATP dependent DNA ligase [Coprinopsis cinerea okayama7|uniref:ATP dependent DNA ligase n=1 Tax=Coprinopsis cinerea (strain Okayama-7 / 130 / ATCC MYA-4618 / FGSC 9003) TaxID=240176 RepID=A8N3N5_COPC7|nr:ATP dependent DNA ligase [Coprinopsis cinerea okayama7\|eukprot:XP_001829501.1 ATP dependent DNA ligase [Coprinopsis cinerea okayama7\
MEEVKLTKARGVLALVGDKVDAAAAQTLQHTSIAALGLRLPSFDPSKAYHVTLLTKEELKLVAPENLASIKPDTRHVHFVGLGGNKSSEVFFVVVIWAAGQQIRKQLGLPPKDFHVTLSDRDDHSMDKSLHSLLPGQFPTSPSPELLDHLAFTFHAKGQFHEAQEYSTKHVVSHPESHRGYLRLADAAINNEQFKLAMLSYAAAYDRTEDHKPRTYCVKRLVQCAQETEWGCVFQEQEIAQIPVSAAHLLITPWSSDLRSALAESNITPTLCLQPRDSLYIPKRLEPGKFDISQLYKLPRFFRWLIPFRFAIMSTPRREEDIVALASSALGIRHVLTLTEEQPLEKDWFDGRSIINTFLPIPNYHPPSIEQMDIVMRMFLDEDKLPLLVHCGGGKGRAGTVAACYMVACGFKAPSYDQTQPEMSAADAMTALRSLRPGSIETSHQEAFISKWCSTLWKRQCIFPDLPTEPPPCPLVVEGSFHAKEDFDLVMLVGLPGSGKTWVSKSLVARNPNGWQRISQDDSGSRSFCETEIGRKPKGRVLLDRCNMSAADRKAWLDLASNWCTNPVCVWFDYDRELCLARAQLRADHPTLPPGNRVRNAVDQMSKIFERPTVEEGFKAVLIVRSFTAARELVGLFSPPPGIYKFPRTPHLINLGAATEDDIQLDLANLNIPGHVVITEKVDGANMGFSLSHDKQIIVQNRSHYVNSATHAQFRRLGAWIERHRDELTKLLDRDPYFPERYILFGEWVYATHSIPYSRLPDYFIAFDFYDRTTGTFASPEVLKTMLASTTIRSVPILHEGAMPTDGELREMVQRPSSFYEGRIEGVYVKVERGSQVVFRGKVVRKDFISGNEHWTRGPLQVNSLSTEIP